jgi:hypothetical protein
MKQIRKRLTYANVMSSLAVFLILGGATAFAAVQKIGANEIKANSIKTGKIVKEAVTAGKIKNGAITETKIADGAVTTNKIANDAVTGDKVKESTLGEVPKAASAANAEKLGGLASGAFQPRIRWALVSPTAVILRQSGGITAVDLGGGLYQLDFGANVSNSGLTGNTVDNGTAGGPLSLMSCADSSASGFGSCLGGVNPNIVKIVTTNAAGTITPRTFYLEVAG